MMLRHFYHSWISPQRWLERVGVRPSMQIVIGLILLTTCVLQLAKALRIAPSEDEASLRMRTLLAEMASSHLAMALTNGDFHAARDFLQKMVDRYDDVLSAGLRDHNGSMVIQTADHEKHWVGAQSNVSTPTHFQILLYENAKPWGQAEICFTPLQKPTTWSAWLSTPSVRLTAFIIAGLFLLYWIFLSRMLRTLDPSAAVPERMQLLMDTLVEGMVILDENERIVMANQAFASTSFLSVERLIGRTLSSFPWLADDGQRSPEVYPWKAAQESDLPQRAVPMQLQIGTRHVRRLNVNASPIRDPDGTRMGVLVTLDDQTVVDSGNLQLQALIAKFSEAGNDIRQLRGQLDADVDHAQLAKLEELVGAASEMARVCQSATAKTENPANYQAR